jgi:hypothetical protein
MAEISESILDKNAQKLFNAAIKSHEILFAADTSFPFTLFPDSVTLDREKITIAQRFFFRTAKVVSSRIKDIQGVELDVGPFFGSVKISSRFFDDDHKTISFLKRSQAIKLAKLIRGFVIASQEDIDVRNVPKNELLMLLEDLGKGVPD